MSAIGKRHRRRGALGVALEAAHARAARLSASPPLVPRRAPLVDAALRVRSATDADTRELGRASTAPEPSGAPTSVWLVHADAALMGGDYAWVEEARARAEASGLGAARPSIVVCDLFVDDLLLDRALDAGADAVGLVARTMTEAELLERTASARTRKLAVAIECHDAAEVGRAADAGADAILVALYDRDRGRPDPEAALVVREHAVRLGLAALDVLAHAPRRAAQDEGSTLDADPEAT